MQRLKWAAGANPTLHSVAAELGRALGESNRAVQVSGAWRTGVGVGWWPGWGGMGATNPSTFLLVCAHVGIYSYFSSCCEMFLSLLPSSLLSSLCPQRELDLATELVSLSNAVLHFEAQNTTTPESASSDAAFLALISRCRTHTSHTHTHTVSHTHKHSSHTHTKKTWTQALLRETHACTETHMHIDTHTHTHTHTHRVPRTVQQVSKQQATHTRTH